MDAQQFVNEMQQEVRPNNVFGAPIQVDGVTLLPAMMVRGGAGARGGDRGGAGYGVRARPVGIYVLRDGKVSWRPAVDVNRIIWGGQMIGLVAAVGSVLRMQRLGRRSRFVRRLGLLALLARVTRRRSSASRWLRLGK
jgi:uncharacterized spore protein YtfJ